LKRFGPAREGEVVYQVREAVDGALWVGTNRGLTILRPGKPELRRPDILGAIFQDRPLTLWLGTLGHGLLLDREGRETAFLAPIALPDNSVSAILEDVEKNIWVGTDDGLVRMTSPSVGLLNARNGLEDDNVSSVYHDHHGII